MGNVVVAALLPLVVDAGKLLLTWLRGRVAAARASHDNLVLSRTRARLARLNNNPANSLAPGRLRGGRLDSGRNDSGRNDSGRVERGGCLGGLLLLLRRRGG
eukprot:scaffold117241_cov32-Tisochrysis_lutea.AAC.3